MVSKVQAAVYVCLCVFVCQLRATHNTAKMNRTIQNLLKHYDIPQRERFTGPVFSRHALDGKPQIARVFMSGVLETYEKLFGHMLSQLQTPAPATGNAAAKEKVSDVRKELDYVLKEVRLLRNNQYQDQNRLLQGLKALSEIQMENRTVQSKALMELPRLYKNASSLIDDNETQRRRRRRRRQTRKENIQGRQQ